MTSRSKRTTVYLDPVLYKALKLKALDCEMSVSEIINETIKERLIEEVEDLADIEKRRKETPITYEEFIKRLKKDGLI